MRCMPFFLDNEERHLTREGKVLRIRKEGTDIRLTYKSPVSQEVIKEMEELETSVQDFGTLVQIFEQLGYQIMTQTRKFRNTV